MGWLRQLPGISCRADIQIILAGKQSPERIRYGTLPSRSSCNEDQQFDIVDFFDVF
jgi:hypothetical protein